LVGRFWLGVGGGAFWAGAEEFELVVEVLEAGFLADFFLELVDGAGGLDGLDAAAVGADEVVAVGAGDEEGEVGGALVEAEAADHALIGEALEEAEDGGLIAGLGEVSAAAEFGEGHGAVVGGEAVENGCEGFGAAKSGGFGTFEKFFVEGHFLKEAWLAAGVAGNFGADLGVGGGHGDAASGGSFYKSLHDEEGFVDFFEGGGVLADGDGEGGESYGAAIEFIDHDFEEALVHFIEPVHVDLDHGEGVGGDFFGDGAIGADLGEVADPAEEVVCDAGGATGAAGDFDGSLRDDGEVEYFCGALDDDGELLVGVVVESVEEAEAGAEGGGEHAGAGGGADEGELWQLKLDGAGGGAGVDDDIEPEVFHGGVEVFLDGGVEAVDFIDEEDIAALEIGEDAGEVARFFDLGAGGGVEGGADGGGDDVCEGRFSETGRAGEEDVLEDVVALFGGFDHEHESLGDLFLAVEVLESGGAKGEIERGFGGAGSFLEVGF